jgi:hypothetical protein
MAKPGNRDHATPFTRNAPRGSLADRLNEDTGIKDAVGATGNGALRVLESPRTANLKGPKEQSANKPFRTVGPERS